MLQKCAIIGLALLLAGGLAMAWVYNETQTEQAQTPDVRRSNTRWARRNTSTSTAAGTSSARNSRTNSFWNWTGTARTRRPSNSPSNRTRDCGPTWTSWPPDRWNPATSPTSFMAPAGRTRSSGYKKLKEKMEIAQIISIVCLSIGGVPFRTVHLPLGGADRSFDSSAARQRSDRARGGAPAQGRADGHPDPRSRRGPAGPRRAAQAGKKTIGPCRRRPRRIPRPAAAPCASPRRARNSSPPWWRRVHE